MCRISVVMFVLSLVQRAKERRKLSFPSLNLSSFLSVVRRFLAESDTDMSLVPGYDGVDVSICSTPYANFRFAKDVQYILQMLTSTQSYASSKGMAGSVL